MSLQINDHRLRSFHRAHFPGQCIPQLQERSTLLPGSLTSALHEDEDLDELGWYDDGIKRTLTDEQIAMFRHSEIQRLLQQRKLNAYLPGSHSSIQANEEPGQSTQSKTAKRKKRLSGFTALQSEDVKLDCGRAGEKVVLSHGQVECQGHHRRVVQYADELDGLDQLNAEEGAHDPSSTIRASRNFHWPKLGP